MTRGLEAAAGLAMAVAVAAALTGGGLRIGPLMLPARELWRPLLLALALAGGAALLAWRAAASGGAPVASGGGVAQGAGSALVDTAFAIACWCGAAAGVLLWCHYQIRFCGGSDSYGYVSAAHTLARGQAILPQPMVQWLPFPNALPVATPLGWSPAPSGDAVVPGYPLGLSIVMALFLLAAGPGAEFYVPLVSGVGLLLVVYRLTARLADWKIAAVATLIVAFNPVVTNMVIQPMSDVPAAFFYLLAFSLLIAGPGLLPLAGLAAGMAIWTRPMLIVMLPALLWLLPRTRRAWLEFAAGLAPVGAAIAGAQWHLYGSPLRTGYGTQPGLFRLSMLAQNAPTYAKWIATAHTPLVFVAFAAGIWRGPRRLAVAATIGLSLGILPYLFKAPYFDDFGLVRYILQALIPCLLVAVVGVGVLFTRHLPRTAAAVALLILAVGSAATSYRVVAAEGTFQALTQESRYAAVGAWVRDRTPPGAVVLSEIHSGSLRFYAQRDTLRFILLPPDRLAATVRAASGRGIACLAALDGDEEGRFFRERFARELEHVALEPIGAVRGTIVYRLHAKDR